MDNSLIFKFKTDISKINIPDKLNNPFSLDISELGKIAATEFQNFLETASPNWTYDFSNRPGKMFGILVVQQIDDSFGFIGAMSGNLPENKTADKCIPSIFDEATEDYFFNKEMKEITVITNKIKQANSPILIKALHKTRSNKSKEVQRKLFENFNFLNSLGEEKNIIPIFAAAINKQPPAGSGECAAPKLLHYALKNNLKPISIAEFWWGNPTKNKEKIHKAFYPACKSKCRPILEYMLNNQQLFEAAQLVY